MPSPSTSHLVYAVEWLYYEMASVHQLAIGVTERVQHVLLFEWPWEWNCCELLNSFLHMLAHGPAGYLLQSSPAFFRI